MKTIAMMIEKGGVGKTTLAVHLAAWLADRGQTVLLIDADAQAHATRLCGGTPIPGLYNLLCRDASWGSVLTRVSEHMYHSEDSVLGGGLLLLPGNVETMAIPMLVSDATTLRRRLAELDGSGIGTCIIDTSPSPSLFNAAVLAVVDGVVLPTQAEFLSVAALGSTLANIEQFNRMRPGHPARVLGIQPTQVRSGTVEHHETLTHLREKYGALLWPPVTDRISWAEAAMQRRAIWAAASANPAAVQEAMGFLTCAAAALETMEADRVEA